MERRIAGTDGATKWTRFGYTVSKVKQATTVPGIFDVEFELWRRDIPDVVKHLVGSVVEEHGKHRHCQLHAQEHREEEDDKRQQRSMLAAHCKEAKQGCDTHKD